MYLHEDRVLDFLVQPVNLSVALELASWIERRDLRSNAPAAARVLLANHQDLDTACEIVRMLKRGRYDIYARFWDHVHKALEEKLARRKDRARWQIVLSLPRDKANTYLSILPEDGMISGACQVAAEALAKKCYYGVYVASHSDASGNLVEALRHEKFRKNSKWAGWRYLREAGLAAFEDESDDIVRINADNHSTVRPLATTVVNLMWDLFERYAKDIVTLNTGRPERPRKRPR